MAAAARAAEPEMEALLDRAVHPSAEFETPGSWPRRVAGAAYLLLLVVCAFLDAALLAQPLYALRWLLGEARVACRPVERALESWFFAMLAGLLELAGGVRVAVSADQHEDDALAFPPDARVLLISNHRSEVDWVFFWNLGLRLGCHDRIRVMMKAVIRFAPGLGWALVLLNFPFVKRDWATDQARITKLMAAYRDYIPGVWLAMFPEGTALYDKTLEQSHAFAKSRGEPQWQYVLHPRVKGFELCVKELDPDYIVDLTIAYPELIDGIRPSPLRFLRGQFPEQVDIHVQRYHRSELFKHKDKMGNWLKQKFQEKENLLQSYYQHGEFVGKKAVCEQMSIKSMVYSGIAFNLFVIAVAVYLMMAFQWSTLAWLAVCAAFSVQKARSFGQDDKQA